ncbi:MAG: PepSY domain-containing protein, partial [Tabrizicola sp.]
TPMPASGSLAGTAAVAAPVTIDAVTAFADGLGFDRRYQLNLPEGETGVWTISHDSMSNDGPNPGADRTIHIDRYTGNVLADIRYADYSAYAKAMAWGIAFHEGDLGAWNLALNTLFCLSVILVSVSGLVRWVKRRPVGVRLGAPPRPADIPYAKGALLVTLALALAFPMLGLTLLAVSLLDLVVLSALPPLRRMVG